LLTIKQRTKNNQTDGSKTETTLILCGYSRERANNRGDNYKRGGEEKKNEKICRQASRQTKNNQAHGSKTEATLILCGYSGERANNRGDSTIKEEVRRRKMRKFADKQSSKQRTIKRFKH